MQAILQVSVAQLHLERGNTNGALILFKKTRYYAAWGLILTLAAVFPANIYLAQSDGVVMGTSSAVAWYRLPFQSLFIVLAYWHRN